MTSRFRFSALSASSRRRALGAMLPVLACVTFASHAQAQTVVTPPAAAEGTVAVLPGGPQRPGTPIIVASVVDTSGNVDNAKKALGLASTALKATPGYDPLSASQYAPVSEALAKDSLKVNWAWPFTATDYQKIGKASKAPRALSLTVSPTNAGIEAVAEVYSTDKGALVGYGKGFGSGENGLEAAVSNAITELGKTATIGGIVISKPSGYMARLSLGEKSGARGGARVEYLDGNGQPFAYGTIFDVAPGESLATVAPETAYPDVFVNGRVRLVNNPTAKRALPTQIEIEERDYKKFEKSFGVAVGIAAAVYIVAIRN